MIGSSALPGWLRSILLWGGIAALTFGLAWAFFSWRWTVDLRVVTAENVIVYLVLLPLAVLLALMLVMWLVRRARRKRAARSASGNPAAPQPTEAGTERKPPKRAAVLACALVNAAGADADTVIERMRTGHRIADLDDQIRDTAGDLLLTGRIRDLEDSAEVPGLQEVAAVAGLSHGDGRLTRDWRLHALLGRVFGDISSGIDLAPILAPSPVVPVAIGEAPSASTTIVKTGKPPEPGTLPVYLFVGSSINPEQRKLLEVVFAQLWESSPWASQRYRLDIGEDNGIQALVELDRLMDSAAVETAAALLLAVDSWFDDELLARLEAEGELNTPRNPVGMIPAEGAAALMMGGAAACRARGLASMAELHHGHFISREKPVSRTGKPGAQVLNECVQRAMENAHCERKQIGVVACDSDFCNGRNVEVAVSMTDSTPELDAVADRLGINMLVGNLGAASALSCVVLASAFVEAEQEPALVMSVRDVTRRGAMLIAPPQVQEQPSEMEAEREDASPDTTLQAA
jgi:hypothetical protein